jgi:pyruvate dehydrogenase E1 component
VIIGHGIREMLVEQQDVFYYVTLGNENYAQPDLPKGAEHDVVRGCYQFASFPAEHKRGSPRTTQKVTLLGSGAILTEVIKAAWQLASQDIACDVFSVTSWSELARNGVGCEQRALRGEAHTVPFVRELLKGSAGPIIAATDYVRAVPESIRAFLPDGRRYITLGTDGFGRSDTRAALREFFGVDAASIARAAQHAL